MYIIKPEDFKSYWEEVAAEASAFEPQVENRPWQLEDPSFEGEYIIDGKVPGRVEPPPVDPFAFRWDSHAIVTGLAIRNVSFHSADGQKVGGLLQYPRNGDCRRYAGIVHFTGYGGELMLDADFVSAGYAVLNFSHRGMLLGSEGFDRYAPVPLLVRNIENRRAYVYRSILLDCLLALKVMRSLEVIDPQRMAVMGTSQGGGLSIIVGALDPGVRCLSADLPWLTDFQYQLGHEVEGPYQELKEYLRRRPEQERVVLETLGYYDTLHFADLLTQPALISLGQKDTTCAPQSVRRLFERIPTLKLLLEIPEMGHQRSTIWRYLTARWFDFYL